MDPQLTARLPGPAIEISGFGRRATSWCGLVLPGSPPVPARVHRPAARPPAGLLVWAHGGSWQRGSAADWHDATAALAAWSGWTVISVDYRLAPRHRHPAAVQDVLTALGWARGQSAGLPLAVGGDSAGGTIAAGAALAARDRGLPLAAQVLAYPPFDPACAAPSYHRSPSAFPQAAALRRAWRARLGDGPAAVRDADGTRLYATHWQAPTLAGLAPAVLAVGRDDPVHDDVEAYAHRLREDGVPVRLLRPPGAVHGDVLRPDRPLLHSLARALCALRAGSTSERTHDDDERSPRPA
ncbi:esterase [Nonomuraea sp. WAC 01424]|uniref:alpha/beta hydrolase n=1 Tax=Nonomuraea sp. WAC 01424 TaxID=2203200 RepID=UPI000F779277|nr:alpha/beta hydrolase [Nonomuraea sp. WAC 01424]RSN11699.1 esterase [Nonomuraea sp. WAC 01424]